MKKIFTLILIFSLTMQIFAQEKLEKGVGDIATVMKYESEKATILAPLLLNIFLSLGIGSFVQGDYIGGGALLGSQVLGGILLLTGYIFESNANVPPGRISIVGATLIGIGSLTIAASHITGIIIPFKFANRYNADLKKRLGIALAGLEPNFDIGINGFQLSFKKSY
ncbi:P13 family porin [Borreliella burgdorferi]|uniref:Borrelia membrane P13 family protein n=1 Tax=Borrelia bissettiae (strain DSM 17990 / CIP 109136 / DN127) TaxID=521010 RepID=G0APJ7_BORBD|nr:MULTISPECIES: P13 family porin [Borreliella]ACN55887.1 Borrelia membrane protein P13 [Borreliella burgdorferi CA-11.2A]AEL19623.1 borrelia membrane P13 family protein [Borreliella bissettiae DN127]MCD2321918.1 P13 family porin [Borreliella burgdorferi]MCD2371313.1 P13 family porin [Borreliella burgdorferi]MCD2373688.1 P13 family porin [Borreliella burgdorferi]